MVTTEQVKALRESTGLSVMQVKKALEETNGDAVKALELLKKKSKDVAAKRTDKTFGAGTVASYIHGNGTVGVLVELVSETDFVSNNEEFKRLAYDIAMHIAATMPEFVHMEHVSEDIKKGAKELFVKDLEGKPKELHDKILEGKLAAYFKERVLMDQPFIKNPDQTIRDLIEAAIHKFGEKIDVRRFARYSVR